MPIVASDIKFALSGGAINTDPDSSLGGIISNTFIVTAQLHNLFDLVTSSESQTGDIEYRCIYILNSHATLDLFNSAVYIQFQTPSPDTSGRIGLGTSAINGTEQTIANENTTPSGITWESQTGTTNSLSIGDLPPGGHKALWLERTVVPGAAAYNSDMLSIQVVGDTAA